MPSFPNDNWTRVEIFLRAYGRLPERHDDGITEETLDLYCKNWEEGKLKTVTVDLEQIYHAIKRGEVKTSEELFKEAEGERLRK